MIEKAMKECHIALKPNRNAKQQVRQHKERKYCLQRKLSFIFYVVYYRYVKKFNDRLRDPAL